MLKFEQNMCADKSSMLTKFGGAGHMNAILEAKN